MTNNNIEIKEKEIFYTSTVKYKNQNCKIKLPKIKNVKIVYSRQHEGRLLNATLSKDTDKKYYISLCCTDIERIFEEYNVDMSVIDLDYVFNAKALETQWFNQVDLEIIPDVLIDELKRLMMG